MSLRGFSTTMAAVLWLTGVLAVGGIVVRAAQGRLCEVPAVGTLLTRAGENAAPLAILGVFAWLLTEIALHAVRVAQEHRAVQLLAGTTLANLARREWSSKTRAGRRARLVADHSLAAPGYVQEAVPATASLDAGALENSYSLTRAAVWALPVLGFLGTAWGLTGAIAGFGQALAEARDLGALVDRLGRLVLPELANAFATTLLALGATLLAHFCTTAVQSWDWQALYELDLASLALLAAIPPTPLQGTAASPELAEALAELTGVLRRIDHGLDLDRAARESLGSAGVLQAAAEQLQQAARALEGAAAAPLHVTISRGEVP